MARIRALLGGGHSPEKIALSLAAGATLGLFPIFGATTFLCLGVGAVFRLNHAALQLANQLMYPLQLALILVFVRVGRWLVGGPALISRDAFFAPRGDTHALLENLARVGLSAVAGWALLAPAIVAALYCAALFPLRRLARP